MRNLVSGIPVTNTTLIVLITIARLWYRLVTLKRLRADDWWMVAAVLFLIGYTASQIGVNVYGSGYHTINVPDAWLEPHWHYSTGYCGYYIVVSCIKASVCFCFLEILPHHLKALRFWVYGLCALIVSLGITMTFSWLFACQPFLSNFDWDVLASYCINYDIFRWLWIAVSVPIDVVLLYVPYKLLKKMRLQTHEQRILKLIFGANLLGTITCILGIYGVYENRTTNQLDQFYVETIFIMLNDIEILMYTLGATFPVYSRVIIQKVSASIRHPADQNFSSWARNVPTLFRSFVWKEDSNATHMKDLPNHQGRDRTDQKWVLDKNTKVFDTPNNTAEEGSRTGILVRERDLEPGCTPWFSLKLENGSTSENEAILLRSESGTSSGVGHQVSIEESQAV
ncbi:hypothetical protein F5884DRAFT_803653 [Xylogone sp. PMI_703]|nr:hypothetical protein F5884DRAFT_803653 [Xylogone sp. PMI_703]